MLQNCSLVPWLLTSRQKKEQVGKILVFTTLQQTFCVRRASTICAESAGIDEGFGMGLGLGLSCLVAESWPGRRPTVMVGRELDMRFNKTGQCHLETLCARESPSMSEKA